MLKTRKIISFGLVFSLIAVSNETLAADAQTVQSTTTGHNCDSSCSMIAAGQPTSWNIGTATATSLNTSGSSATGLGNLGGATTITGGTGGVTGTNAPAVTITGQNGAGTLNTATVRTL